MLGNEYPRVADAGKWNVNGSFLTRGYRRVTPTEFSQVDPRTGETRESLVLAMYGMLEEASWG